MNEVLPGDMLSFDTDRCTAVGALERCLAPFAGYYPYHVALVENDDGGSIMSASTLTLREAVPPVVRVNRFATLYGAAVQAGVIRVRVYRLQGWGVVDAGMGLLATRRTHRVGQKYNHGRTIMGLFPDPRKTVCSELWRSFKIASGHGDIPKLNAVDRMRNRIYEATVTPLHCVMDPGVWLVGSLVWEGGKFVCR